MKSAEGFFFVCLLSLLKVFLHGRDERTAQSITRALSTRLVNLLFKTLKKITKNNRLQCAQFHFYACSVLFVRFLPFLLRTVGYTRTWLKF